MRYLSGLRSDRYDMTPRTVERPHDPTWVWVARPLWGEGLPGRFGRIGLPSLPWCADSSRACAFPDENPPPTPLAHSTLGVKGVSAMNTTLVSMGFVAVLAAIAGGGLEALGVKIPVVDSFRRQLLMAIVGGLLVVVGLMVGGSDEGGSAPTTPATLTTATTPTTTPDQTTSTPPTTSATPATTTDPQVTPSTSTKGSESGASVVPSETQAGATGRQLNASVSRGWETDSRGGEFFLLPPGAIAASEIPPRLESLYDFVISEGGVPARTANFGVTLSTTSDGTVVVLSIAPRIVERSTASPGALLRHGYGCGVPEIRYIEIDFDSAPPTVALIDQGSEVPLPVYSVRRDDIEIFAITATSTGDDIRFVVDILYELNGQMDTLTIDDDGAPFRVTGVSEDAPFYDYYYQDGSHGPYEPPFRYAFC